MKSFALVLISFAVVLTPAAPTTPKPGRKVRKELMDSLRSATKKVLANKPVVWKVNHLLVEGDWAFMMGVPQQPSGKAFDYRGTELWDQVQEGIFDDWVCALFVKSKGKWTVKQWQIGATDVAWFGWWEDFKAPRSIFPKAG